MKRKPSEPSAAPQHLPMLTTGRHRDPTDGACVMEYVSVLAGSRFSDHPRCTHRAVSALARAVNDRIVDDTVRGELARLAPDLIGLGRGDRRTTDRVVASCLLAAAAIRPLSPAAARRLDRARARAGGPDRVGGWRRLRERCAEALQPVSGPVASAFQVVVEHMRVLPEPERDRRLRDLLRDAVAECRKRDGVLDGVRTPAGSVAV